MHQNNKKAQCAKTIKKSKKYQCLICFQSIERHMSIRSLLKKPLICERCAQQLILSDDILMIDNVKVYVLYQENGFLEQLYHRYVNLYDYALKDAFMFPYLEQLKSHYHDYVIVTFLGNRQDNEKRLFSSDVSLVQCFSSDYLSIDEAGIIEGGNHLSGKKVLLFAGMMSRPAYQRAIKTISTYHPQTVEGIVLFVDMF